jgi:broad specificity phosphatase PhoE
MSGDAQRGRLWLLRHGDTDWAASGRHTGRTDIPLNPAGELTARARRSDIDGHSFSLILTSPLHRAIHTAELAGVTPDAIDADLVEWDYGAWEGRTTAEIREELHDPQWTIWNAPIPPGATPGEQTEDVGVRTQRVIDRCMPHILDGRDCLLVAHGHLLRILTATWLDLPARDGRLWALSAGGLSVLGWERDQPVISHWNI